MRKCLAWWSLLVVMGCAGHQATTRMVDGANALVVQWQQLSAQQQQFVLGYTQIRQGRFAEALAHLQPLRRDYAILEDHLLYHTAQAALGAGQLDLAHETATALQQYPDSGLAADATPLLIEIAMQGKRWSEAEALIQTAGRDARSPWERQEVLLMQARLDLARGNAPAAGERYLALYRTAQYPDQIAAARRGMRDLQRAGAGDPLQTLPEHARYQLAREFGARGLAGEAARLLSGIAGVARRELAEAWFRAREYGKAADLYAQLVQANGNDIALLAQYATAAARSGRNQTAVAMQEAIIARGVSAANVQRARTKRAFLLLDHGDYAAAAAAYRELLGGVAAEGATQQSGGCRGESAARRASGPPCFSERPAVPARAKDMLWAVAWAEYRQRHPDAALAALAELEGLVGADRL